MSLASVGADTTASMLAGSLANRRRTMGIATRTQIAERTLPLLIQGGMGVAVSNHRRGMERQVAL
jgi:hypothetical protein